MVVCSILMIFSAGVMLINFRRHLMTGTGAYFYITWGIWLRHCLNGKQDEYELQWPSLFFSLPLVVRKGAGAKAQNGSLKKEL